MFDTELQRHLLTIEFNGKMSTILRTAHAQQSLLHAHTSLRSIFYLTIFGRMPGRPVTVDVYNNFIWRSKTVS